MTVATLDVLRQQLEDRRARLHDALQRVGSDDDLVFLLQQVDAALGAMGSGDYARCLVCDGHVDERDLLLNPLLQYCLCDLSADQQRALERDLERARRIQAALLPDADVRTGGWEAHYRYEPAGMIGGDYCDLWERPGEAGTIYFAIGDVAGKGIAASLLMAHLQAAFRSRVEAGAPLVEIVERVNRQLLDAAIPTHYATLACGRADAEGRVEIVNAGHCPPLLVANGQITAVAATGLPIGLTGERRYEVERLQLAEHDTLVLYTDGVTEARGPGGGMYGQERIERLLARRPVPATSRQVVQAIRDDLRGFADGAGGPDDLTLLALRRTGRADIAAA